MSTEKDNNSYVTPTDSNEEKLPESLDPKARPQGEEAREELFKQNILMDVDERPDGIEAGEQIEAKADIEQIDDINRESDTLVDDGSVINRASTAPVEADEKDKQESQQVEQASLAAGGENELNQGGQDSDVSVQDQYDIAENNNSVSAFNYTSVDQQIEDALAQTSVPEDTDNSDPTNPDVDPDPIIPNVGASPVTDTDAAANAVGESVSIGATVGVTAFASDPDASDSISYSLSSNPNNAFAIDPNTGEVTVADPSGLDFETAQTMQIEVTAISTDGSSNSETFDIAITDDNTEFSISAVTDSDVAANSINESLRQLATVWV